MMRNLLYFLIIITSFECKAETLKVTVGNQYSGEAYLFNTITQKIDTLESSGNSFVVNYRDIETPTLFYLMFKDINNLSRPIYLILSNQETHIKFNELIVINENSQQIRDIYPNRPLFLADPNNNGAFYKFQDLWIEFHNNVTKPKLDVKARKKIHSKFINESKYIIEANKNKLVSAFIIDFLMNENLIQLNNIQLFYSYLEHSIQKSLLGIKIKNEVGFDIQTIAPKFSFQDYHGNYYSLDSLIGEQVLLHFWSSTCAPCIDEVPDLINLSKEKDGLIIINISLDTEKKSWTSMIERLGISDMINHCDFKGVKGEICSDYNIKFIPAYYLIDREGKILFKKQSIQKLIDEL